MTKSNIIRAWKDEAFRLSLSEAERAMVPENPAGEISLEDLEYINGGIEGFDILEDGMRGTYKLLTMGCCPDGWTI
jgi:mersacidin/lichenicidin family type 2 lantibiotic